MKLSKIFHFLYFSVLAIPLVTIPIFALNILHKETEPISIEVQEKLSIDFNQYWQDTYGFNLWANASSATYVQGGYELIATNSVNVYSQFYNYNSINVLQNHKYLVNFNAQVLPNYTYPSFYANIGNVNGTIENTIGLYQSILMPTITQKRFSIYFQNGTNLGFKITGLNIFDLTQMFGEGNEPTIEQFNSIFNNYYYEYTTSEKKLVNKPTITTFNNTDIGSQFLYSLYKPIRDYCNFANYFGLNGVYDWFLMNFFNGTAPLVFFIFFNLMIYWLFISLLWLLFDVLIYVPMVAHRWLDKGALE